MAALHGIAKTNNNTILYIEDPNNVNINTNISNGIPQYQDMHINVELTATRKGRSVITEGLGLFTEDKLDVNFIGNNQNIHSPHYLSFTTNYYDGSTSSSEVQYESFGITSVKVSVNSSFIPQVNVQFVDIRGLSFFNQEKSPYRILFDFPPPIFNLKIKGYYGKTLEYNLHLTKYTTEFKAENGNFIIDASFVGITYAPLSDILFRYAVNAPFCEKNIGELITDRNVKPINTYDFILKLRNLYGAFEAQNVKDQVDRLKEIDDEILGYTAAMSKLSDFSNQLKDNSVGSPYLFYVDNNTVQIRNVNVVGNVTSIVPVYEYTTLTDLNEYDTIITTQKINQMPSSINNRLCIGFVNTSPSKINAINKLNQYKDSLIGSLIPIKQNRLDIQGPTEIICSRTNNNTTVEIPFIVLDVTNFYINTYRNKVSAEEEKNYQNTSINNVINSTIEETLGMIPTIYNVFKLILDDVDEFFKLLRECSKKAEEHHNDPNNKKIIVDAIAEGSKNNSAYMYSFPLIADEQQVVNCVKQKVRISPEKIDLKLTNKFPEMEFIRKFIDTFLKQRQIEINYNLKGQKNDDGTNKWIPLTPLDSTLPPQSNPNSPYWKISSGQFNENINALKIFLNRFYVLSQFALSKDFYSTIYPTISEGYIDLFASAEAINLVLSLNDYGNKNQRDNFKTMAQGYSSNIQSFYNDLEKYNKEIPEYGILNGIVTNADTYEIKRPLNEDLYVAIDKTNPEYRGVDMCYTDLKDQITGGGGILEDFINNVQTKNYGSIFSSKKLKTKMYTFTMENIIYIPDSVVVKGKLEDQTTEISDETRFINGGISEIQSDKSTDYGRTYIESLYTKGNQHLKDIMKKNYNLDPKEVADKFTNFSNIWQSALSWNGHYILQYLNKSNQKTMKIASIIILSNMGFAMGPFNSYSNNLCENIFQIPGIIEIPKFYAPYIGSLIYLKEPNSENLQIEDIVKIFSGGTTPYTRRDDFPILNCTYLFADYFDVNKYLSERDKTIFLAEYNNFFNNDFININDSLKKLIDRVINEVSTKVTNPTYSDYLTKYEVYLNPKTTAANDDYYSLIIKPLVERTNIMVYGQDVFNYKIGGNTYEALKIQNNNNASKKTSNDRFFKNFFTELYNQLNKPLSAQDNQLYELTNTLSDSDILTQLYYSFKNLNDKWLTSPSSAYDNTYYPYNTKNKKLIDSFTFVDRALNPIGNTVINPEVLLDLFKDPTVSVFTVLSQLLSLNHFEFFPLQNFIFHDDASWEDTFKIDSSGAVDKTSAFVCMYFGGSSSYPTSLNDNGFENDGIVDLGTTDALDFVDCGQNAISVADNNPNFNYKQVRAFKVMFGQQNQSMFKDIRIDSKEYPETNESIQILSRIADNINSNTQTAKGQNLYNIYENRAYSATVTGLGNAMIQPTQYFQLDNVPLFNGAYLILSVEHDIQPNNMTTSFTGTKILKFPIPRVTNAATAFGFGDYAASDGGTPTVGSHAPFISVARATQLNSVFGIDISHHQGNIDWYKLTHSPSTDIPPLKFAFIKVSQGTGYTDSQRIVNAKNAVANGLKIGYYHFGRPYIGNDPATNATEQAAHFLRTVAKLPKPNFPLVFDFEDNSNTGEKWSSNKAKNDLFIQTFFDYLKNNGYDSILYASTGWIGSHITTTKFISYPIWGAQYLKQPEISDPHVPTGWNRLDIWQFSDQGRLYGYNGNLDLNLMKTDFFNKY